MTDAADPGFVDVLRGADDDDLANLGFSVTMLAIGTVGSVATYPTFWPGFAFGMITALAALGIHGRVRAIAADLDGGARGDG